MQSAGNDNRLWDRLESYSQSDVLRFHMPGHKGKDFGPNSNIKIPYKIDITEILGMDDLHNPQGPILEINRELARYYGVSEARLLVNGSTAGILSCIFVMVCEGDKVLISRASHKSVYHGLMLRKAEPVFIYPKADINGILSPVSIRDIEENIRENPDVKMVVLTSPTYEGVVSDIKDIHEYLQKRNIPLLIDAAHGAHLPHEGDVSVTSLHKTLPFLTQTSCIRISKSASRYIKKIDKALSIFQTSSPSYVLMGAADRSLRFIKSEGDIRLGKLQDYLSEFYKKTEDFRNIRIYRQNYIDPSKIVITVKPDANADYKYEAVGIISNILTKNGIIPEMVTPGYILCMATMMDEQCDFERLFDALKEADKRLKEESSKVTITTGNNSENLADSEDLGKADLKNIKKAVNVMPMHIASEADNEEVALEDAEGRLAANFVDMFPPGIPILIPGERVEKDHLQLVKKAKELNISIRGICDNHIPVVKEV